MWQRQRVIDMVGDKHGIQRRKNQRPPCCHQRIEEGDPGQNDAMPMRRYLRKIILKDQHFDEGDERGVAFSAVEREHTRDKGKERKMDFKIRSEAIEPLRKKG